MAQANEAEPQELPEPKPQALIQSFFASQPAPVVESAIPEIRRLRPDRQQQALTIALLNNDVMASGGLYMIAPMGREKLFNEYHSAVTNAVSSAIGRPPTDPEAQQMTAAIEAFHQTNGGLNLIMQWRAGRMNRNGAVVIGNPIAVAPQNVPRPAGAAGGRNGAAQGNAAGGGAGAGVPQPLPQNGAQPAGGGVAPQGIIPGVPVPQNAAPAGGQNAPMEVALSQYRSNQTNGTTIPYVLRHRNTGAMVG
jgi:hypothetical protein